jgi:hypothetical protein
MDAERADLIRRLRDAAGLMNKGHAVFVPDLLLEVVWALEEREGVFLYDHSPPP